MPKAAASLPDFSHAEARWQAVLARDPAADGHFVYAVRSTGVYCQPSATSRLPKRENVDFFDTAQQAEAAGYRPSRRALGDQQAASAQHAQRVAQACRLIEVSEVLPDLTELAAHVGLSPHHFHRVFKAQTGVTPKAYASACRARRLREALGGGGAGSVTEAIHEAGFNASSRFYEAADALLGMPARDYRAGGAKAEMRFAVGQSVLGAILVAQSQRGICAILMGDDPDALVRDLQDRFPKAHIVGADAGFEQVVAQVVGLVESPARGLNLPLDVRGTAFQVRVWQALQAVPCGSTVNYTQLAERIGSPKAVRAVAQACAANPIAVAIPCHRVVRRDGDISGYRWGVDRKRALLLREGRPTSTKLRTHPAVCFASVAKPALAFAPMTDATPRPELPDHLSIDPRSPHHDATVFQHDIGIRFNDKERFDVEEYCISEGWIRVPAGKAVDRKGRALTIKLKGRVEVFYR